VLLKTPIWCTKRRNTFPWTYSYLPTVWHRQLPYEQTRYVYVPPHAHHTHTLPVSSAEAVPQHTYGGSGGEEYSSYSFTTSALHGGWVVSVTPRPRFTPGERTHGTHWTGSQVGPRAGLDTEARGKISCLCQGSNLDRPVVQSVARHYTDWATPAPTCLFKLFNNPVESLSRRRNMNIKLSTTSLHSNTRTTRRAA
jgi:hypothetical protein